MPNIGKVTIGSTLNQRTISIRQRTQTSIATPTYGPGITLSLEDLSDVDIVNPLQGYTLVYNQTTGRFEVSPPSQILNITGGTF